MSIDIDLMITKLRMQSRISASDMHDTADLLEQLKERLRVAENQVKYLESAWHSVTLERKDYLLAQQERENDRLRQQLEASQKQEPIAVVNAESGTKGCTINNWLDAGTKLYAAPVVVPVQEDIRCQTFMGSRFTEEVLDGNDNAGDRKVPCPDCGASGQLKDIITYNERETLAPQKLYACYCGKTMANKRNHSCSDSDCFPY